MIEVLRKTHQISLQGVSVKERVLSEYFTPLKRRPGHTTKGWWDICVSIQNWMVGLKSVCTSWKIGRYV